MPAARLAFSDEFNGLSLYEGSSGTWKSTFYYGDRTLPGNGEEQYYVDPGYNNIGLDPYRTEAGHLTITAQRAPEALKTQLGGQDYISGMISSEQSFSMQYGYFEMRAQLPAGAGLWPAFWMLPVDGTGPAELDVMEVLGQNPKILYVTAHSNATGVKTEAQGRKLVADMSSGYHTFGVDWGPQVITWYFDGAAAMQIATPADMHGPMYMIANLAVGGYWPGSPDASTPFPAEMKIDYIRAYERLSDHQAQPVPQEWAPIQMSAFSALNGSGATPTWQYRHTMSGEAVKLQMMGDWSRYAIGNSLDNYIAGGSAQYSELDGAGGNDVLRGNGGIDVFVVKDGAGNDTILDLMNTSGNADKIRLDGFHFTHFDDVGPWLTQVGQDTVLRLDEDQALLLKNVAAADLRAEQFVFVNSAPLAAGGGTSGSKPAPALVPGGGAAWGTPAAEPDPVVAGYTGAASTKAVRILDTTVVGTSKRDLLSGGSGNDKIFGRAGNDVLAGGAGRDAFVFDTKLSAKGNRDTISDFDARADMIWVDNKIFAILGKGSAEKPGALKKKFFALEHATDANDHIIYSKKTGILSYDPDGSGEKPATAIAKLKKGMKLDHTDFFVV
jgi:beta-glucanase (GH16 family)